MQHWVHIMAELHRASIFALLLHCNIACNYVVGVEVSTTSATFHCLALVTLHAMVCRF